MKFEKSTIITALTIIFILSVIIITDCNIDKDNGTGVYHFKGEPFNSSISYGLIEVSPEVADSIFYLSLFSLIGIAFIIVIIFTIDPKHIKKKGEVKGW